MVQFDPSIFFRGAEQRRQKTNDMYNMLSGAIQFYDQQNKLKQARIDKAEREALDPNYIRVQKELGNQITPMQQAIFDVEEKKLLSEVKANPVTGEFYRPYAIGRQQISQQPQGVAPNPVMDGINVNEIVPTQANRISGDMRFADEQLSPKSEQLMQEEAIKTKFQLEKEQAKLDFEEKKREPAKKNFDKTLSEVIGYVSDLKEMGSGVSAEKSVLENVPSYIGSTAIGQETQRALGTKEQEIRDMIAAKRPVLFNAIKKASGLTGGELNSQFEVENQLKQLGSATMSIDAQLNILKGLSDQFGLGGVEDLLKTGSEKPKRITAQEFLSQ